MFRLTLILVCVTCNALVFAQIPDSLTLEKCISLAEENSYQLQADDAEIAVAENVVSIAESRAIPTISGELGMDNRFLQPYYFNQMWASVHADWAPGDLIMKTNRSSLQDLETRKLEKEQHRLSVIGRSTSLYMSILQVNKQIEILGLKMILLQRHYQVSRGMWTAGLRSELDMLQTESEIARLKEDSTQLTMVRSNLTIELAQLLGMDSAEGLHLVALQLDAPEVYEVPDISLEHLANNPLLSVLDSRLAAEQFRLDEITAYQIPHVTLGTGFVKDADPTGDGNYLQINTGVTIPIYAGNTYTYQKQGSQAMSESLAAQRSDAERELLIHLMKIHDKLVQTRNLMELQHQRLNISSRAVDFAEVNYKAGIASNIDVISSQQQLTNTELEMEETRLEYVVNLIEFYLTNNQVDRILAMGDTRIVN